MEYNYAHIVTQELYVAPLLHSFTQDDINGWASDKKSNRLSRSTQKIGPDALHHYEERGKYGTKTYDGPEDRLDQGKDETKII